MIISKSFIGYTGDPFRSCRKFTREDLCQPNPCGDGAQCQVSTILRRNWPIILVIHRNNVITLLNSPFSKINLIYSLVMIVVDQTDQSVPAHLEPEETH